MISFLFYLMFKYWFVSIWKWWMFLAFLDTLLVAAFLIGFFIYLMCK